MSLKFILHFRIFEALVKYLLKLDLMSIVHLLIKWALSEQVTRISAIKKIVSISWQISCPPN